MLQATSMSRAWWLALALLVGGGEAGAQPDPEAQRQAGEHFARGERAQQRGLYREAIEAYQEAFALVPHSNTLFNIAVCYEKLGRWSEAVDYYQRYLTAEEDAIDAVEVGDKIRELRARVAPGPISPGDPGSSAVPGPTPIVGQVDQTAPPFVLPPARRRARWHAGLSYGLGFGDTPNERYLAHGGVRIGDRVEVDAIAGKFGKNDTAIGAMTRVLVGTGVTQPFVHGAVTLGYARSDDSSDAATKLPLGLEAGAGVRFGRQGRFELAAVLRFIRGGFDETSTVFDSYIHDDMVFAVDLGLAFDIPLVIAPTGR